MNEHVIMSTYLFTMLISKIQGGVPGTFFWKPRLGLNLNLPTTDFPPSVLKPTLKNIVEGKVVLINGYQAGITIMALAAGFHMADNYEHHNPMSAYFYNNAYRWALRYFSLLPPWLGGTAGHYTETHKVWRKRFFYMNKFVPKWLQSMLFFVKKEEWQKEEGEFKRYSRYVEPSFGKYYRYPGKKFNNWNSLRIEETVENLDSSLSQLW